MKKAISLALALLIFLSLSVEVFALDVSGIENSYSKREWKFANTGSGAAGTATQNGDGSITIANTGGKMADSEEGFSFWYTTVPKDENFVMTATFKVDDAAMADNQSGFGLIVTDVVGPQNSGRYMNYAASGCYKLNGPNSGYRIPGARYVTGYTDPTACSPSENADGSGTSLRVCDMSNSFGDYTMFMTGTVMTFTLRKSNTGYHCTMKFSDEEYILYGVENLLAQDTENVYAGFFVSRKITVTVSDMIFKSIDPAADDPKQEKPIGAEPLSVLVYSPTSTASLDYNYLMRPNAAGSLTLEDTAGNVYIDAQHVEALEYYSEVIRLPNETTTVLKTKFVPDSELLHPMSVQTVVNYRYYGEEGDVLYVSPTVESEGTGTQKDPLNIYSALKYARPGQTIVLMDGEYLLTRKLWIERGVSGRADAPIVVRPENEGAVVFNCLEMNITSGEAFLMAGDYWHLYGITLHSAPGSAKGIRVSGSGCIVEMCNVYNCGNSGIQISGASAEPFERWPSNNLIKNCTSYSNCDPTRQDADGFAAKLTCGDNNRFFGCIAYNNIDDGFDLYAKSVTGSIGAVTIENCIAYNNGYLANDDGATGEGNGFKLGGESMPGAHVLRNCISYGNGAKGITSNSGPDVIVENCTAFNNGTFGKAENVSFYCNIPSQTTAYVINGLLSIGTTAKADRFRLQKQESIFSDTNYISDGTLTANASGASATEAWFVKADVSIAPTRNADGTIDMHGLCELTSAAPAGVGARLDTGETAKSVAPAIEDRGTQAPWIWYAVAVVGVLAIAAVIVVIIRKKKAAK